MTKSNSPRPILTSAGLVLAVVGKSPRSSQREIAKVTGLTQRTVAIILEWMRSQGFLSWRRMSKNRRHNVYLLSDNAETVGALLRAADELWQRTATHEVEQEANHDD